MALSIENFSHSRLHLPRFHVRQGESWCIYGSTTSGAAVLLQLLEGTLKEYNAEYLQLPAPLCCVSFAKQQRLFEEELARDDSDFLNFPDPGTLVREFLPCWKKYRRLVQALDMERCLDTGYRQLSSGQSRKLLFLMAVTRPSSCLVLENPFTGLDQNSRKEIADYLKLKADQKQILLLFINNRDDLIKWCGWCSHLAIIDQEKLLYKDTMPAESALFSILDTISVQYPPLPIYRKKHEKQELVYLCDGFANYGEKQIFSGLNLQIESGDHTLITGHNGCGKSTLFEMITGDNVLCYGNALRIFGIKRGSGESIWQIKREMGIVSPALHRDHRRVGTCLEVVVSGFFDSIGLYTKATQPEITRAREWLSSMGLASLANTPFSHAEYGKQRLVLIARALVKEPRLLMLDEPTQGLDDSYREMLLDFLERIAGENSATIFYISHLADEYRSFFRQKIPLDRYTTADIH